MDVNTDKVPPVALIWLAEVNPVVGSDKLNVIKVGTLTHILGPPVIPTVKLQGGGGGVGGTGGLGQQVEGWQR